MPVDLDEILASIRTCLHRWKFARSEGKAVLGALSNAQLVGTYIDASQSAWGALAQSRATICRTGIAAEAHARKLHNDLNALHDEMLAATAELRRQVSQVWAVAAAGGTVAQDGDLREDISNTLVPRGGDARVTVGGGYGLDDLAVASTEVAEMLDREALVTSIVVRGVGSCLDRDTLTMYASAWIMQPYVDVSRWRELQVMIKEPPS
ncbi:unnamed protein product [Choristocarpus tenellus]